MSNLKNDLKKVLENLVETCRDGAYGYKKAADKVEDKDMGLAQQWREHANVREAYARDLEERLRCIGEDGDEGGSITGALHRGWMDVKAAFTSDEIEKVIEECIRGEESAEKAYRQALEVKMDATSRDLVMRQGNGVTSCLRELEALKMTLAR